MLTAAVRDLHQCNPGEFLTDVRTSAAELWENNPHLTPLSEQDPEVEVIECAYPLIDHSNELPYHCLHGFIDFLNERLGLQIRPTAFKGDIHLSDEEKFWYSQVHELTGEDIPFWIINAGGKADVSVKWWDVGRYQQVVNHFKGRIQFVQVGAIHHHHPKLSGVIDLRGQTTARELVRLVYHAQGVVCGVTALMHLAAAVESKNNDAPLRPCVVIAGAREPAHWECYPNHQFIHNNGALPCATVGGCWKDRIFPLGDGDERDQPEHRCTNVVDGVLPRCMDLISAAEVIRRIESYFDGGVVAALNPAQARAAKQGVARTRANPYDNEPLTLPFARMACEKFLAQMPTNAPKFSGRGIVICGGGAKYFTPAWVCIRLLRHLGCTLPIEFWHLGKDEMDDSMRALLEPFQVRAVDAFEVRKKIPVRRLGGWELKPYAILHSQFEEILFLDADNVPVVDPTFLFDDPQFKKTGAIFWPDYGRFEKTEVIWTSCGIPRPAGPEFESGQMVVNKAVCWRALRLALWFNEQSDFYYQYLYGDKETFHLAFEKLQQPYTLVPHPIHTLPGTMCQHDLEGNRLFQHRNTDKWNLFLRNKVVADFRHEAECRRFVAELQSRWDGRVTTFAKPHRPKPKRIRLRLPTVTACMISCPEREAIRTETLNRLASTDWADEPVLVQVDRTGLPEARERQTQNTFDALQKAFGTGADYALFLEDDLDFNRHIRHNLFQWRPVLDRELTLGSIYNPNLAPSACDLKRQAYIISPHRIYGSQAFLISRRTLRYLLDHWNIGEGMQDIRISRLAGRLKRPIYYHSPSLVQHVGRESVWGGAFHQSPDFDPDWRVDPAP